MFKIGKDCKIDQSAEINVKDGHIGDRAIIGPRAKIEGRYIEIGHEAFLDADAWIGGGSCFDNGSKLIIGDWLHMGRCSHINAISAIIPITMPPVISSSASPVLPTR